MRNARGEDFTGDPPPARVALVMSYPYEAFRGGEASYVAALRSHLAQRGHRVDTLVSDVTRGRLNPVVRLPRDVGDAGELRVRRVTRLGNDRLVSTDPGLLLRSLAATAGRRFKTSDRHGRGEGRWLLKTIQSGGYDAVILLWDAVRYAADVSRICPRVLALKGFYTHQRIRLGEAPVISLPDDVDVELGGAQLIGMNNAAEAQALRRKLPDKTVIQVGMGFAERPPLPPSSDPFVLFVAANSGANRKALDWLCDTIWPRVVSIHPTARLRIVGNIRDGREEAVPAGVDMLGRVQDLDDEYRRAQVVVAPMTVGTAGVKIKVAEALAYRRPLVTTSVGVDPGDPGQFGDAVDVADDPALFAEAVCRLLADGDLRARRVTRSAEAFRAHFAGPAAYGALCEHLAL